MDASNPFRVIHPTQVHVEGYVMTFMDGRAMTHLKQKMNNCASSRFEILVECRIEKHETARERERETAL